MEPRSKSADDALLHGTPRMGPGGIEPPMRQWSIASALASFSRHCCLTDSRLSGPVTGSEGFEPSIYTAKLAPRAGLQAQFYPVLSYLILDHRALQRGAQESNLPKLAESQCLPDRPTPQTTERAGVEPADASLGLSPCTSRLPVCVPLQTRGSASPRWTMPLSPLISCLGWLRTSVLGVASPALPAELRGPPTTAAYPLR